MLYVTTRNNRETYTVHRALTENRSPDGGFFVPMRLPEFDREQIKSLAKRSFNQCTADILNLLLGTRLSAFDLDFSVGRSSARLVKLPHRIWVGECWHNLEWDFARTVRNLWLRVTDQKDTPPTDWFRIALGIGVLFGFFGKLMRKNAAGETAPVDIAVLSGDFTWPMAAWYARAMGLPIANIIICCNDNNNPWELLHNGEMRTGATPIVTDTPRGDCTLPEDLERFVHGCGGSRETERFLSVCGEGRLYVPSDPVLEIMRKGMFASVVGQDRVRSAIPNVYRTHGAVFDPYTALTYSGLLDYRAGAGESRAALILSDQGPGKDLAYLAGLMGMDAAKLKSILNE